MRRTSTNARSPRSSWGSGRGRTGGPVAQLLDVVVGCTGLARRTGQLGQVPRGGQPTLVTCEEVDPGGLVAFQGHRTYVQLLVGAGDRALYLVQELLVLLVHVVQSDEDAVTVCFGLHDG